jgi:hypothetical protein
MKKIINFFLLFTPFLVLGQTVEQEPIIFSSDRPGQSYSAQILPYKGIQWQQGLQLTDFYNSIPAGGLLVYQRELNSISEFRYGLGSGMEFGLAGNFNGRNNPLLNNEFEWSTANPSLQFRFALPGSTDRFSWSMLIQSSFSDLDYRLNLAVIDGPWSVAGNLGMYHSEFEAYSVNWTVNLAYNKDRFSTFAEVYGIMLNSANRDFFAFNAGFAFMLHPRFQYELFAGNKIGVGPAVGVFNNYFLNTGFSWRLR